MNKKYNNVTVEKILQAKKARPAAVFTNVEDFLVWLREPQRK